MAFNISCLAPSLSPSDRNESQETLEPNNLVQLEHARKLNSVKQILSNLTQEDHRRLEAFAMIDAIQRLCLDCYFQEEIHSILEQQCSSFDSRNDNLHDLALCFRLLRQESFNVPAGAFCKFKNELDSNAEITDLLSLYEASQLSVKGEDILDEAALRSYQLLSSVVSDLDCRKAGVVENALKHPHHRTLATFTARNFFNNYQGQNYEWLDLLRELAKLDFQVVQSRHQQEMVKVIKWWKELGLSKELEFVRDQPTKWYMWSMACLTDAYMSEQRIETTKAIAFIYVIDDIFDVRGTLDDLTVFTEVISSWDFTAAEQLPDYMKICFMALDNLINEMSFKIHKKHGWNPRDYMRNAWQTLCNAFLVEAKWFASGRLPSTEDYLKNGIVSTGVHVILIHIFFLLGQNSTKENVETINEGPNIITSIGTILRLWDDLGSAKDENQEGHDGSYIECYMNENPESSMESARDHVIDMISNEWKQLNQECLVPNRIFSSAFNKVCLNTARMVPLMYDYDDNHRLPSLEEHMRFLLSEKIST